MSEEDVLLELRAIAARSDNILQPEDVVEAARDPKSPLHDRFDWNNTEAAHKWRLHQARNLIRVMVEVLPGEKKEFKVFVALRKDPQGNNGYRRTIDVLSDDDLRIQLLAQAKEDFQIFRRKYGRLVELAKIFEEMDKVE